MSSLRNSNTRIGVFLRDIYAFALRYVIRKRLPKGHLGTNSHIHTPSIVAAGSLENIFIGNNCNIDWDNVLYCNGGKFIMKDNSGAAVGLKVITGNHSTLPGHSFKELDNNNDNIIGKDIIVEEEVWIAANVTLLAGTHIGRGSIIGAGTVISGNHIPPYAIAKGNPCKIIGFRFSPDEIIEHEKKLYKQEERLPIDLLNKNYDKYFTKRVKEIREFIKL